MKPLFIKVPGKKKKKKKKETIIVIFFILGQIADLANPPEDILTDVFLKKRGQNDQA